MIKKFFHNPIAVLVLSVISVCSALLIVYRIDRDKPSQPEPSPVVSRSNTLVKDFQIHLYDRNEKKLRGKLSVAGRWMGWENDRLFIFRTPLVRTLTVRDIRMTFYDDGPDGQPCTAVLSAEKAKIHTSSAQDVIGYIASSEIECLGNVVLETQDHRELRCNKLLLNVEDAESLSSPQIIAKENCMLRHDRKTIRADKIITDVTLREFTIHTDEQ